MAELADALDLGSSGNNRGGSSPFSRTINIHNGIDFSVLFDANYLVEFFYIFEVKRDIRVKSYIIRRRGHVCYFEKEKQRVPIKVWLENSEQMDEGCLSRH